MRRLLRVCVVLATLWCVWWGVASYALHSAVVSWFDARRAEGWQADMDGPQPGGFPLNLRTRIADLALADPDTGVAFRAPQITFTASALWPGNITLRLPDTPMTFATPEGAADLTMQDSVMTLDLRRERALGLDRLQWAAQSWQLDGPEGSLIGAKGLSLAAIRTTGATYDITASAPAFAPGAVPRRTLRLPDEWPLTFDQLALEATVTFDRPWDIRALEDRRPQPRWIALHLAEAAWGDLRLRLAADLEVDAAGIPAGTVSIQADNWPIMLDLAEAANLLPGGMRSQAEEVLRRFATLSGNPDALDVQLNLAGGFISLGFLPVAPAPRLILR
ncbi:MULTISPECIES: DUF2125 domain-containing protein [Roseobacteraceae]|uniref:DUF2125 domain-containing protein n=1 Tax=Pseudosulfitobacter pseudonitzschiae TaxID=1402135 RepID=A0A221K2K3_9RHOB|nr:MULTISPECIES: DUF2125 domain-containing protein [Roseobacteraceae]ASM73226.1 hypothetical protein SULPSESMR1_02429 [Pseudosulfitobacter pseudonitzschiae]